MENILQQSVEQGSALQQSENLMADEEQYNKPHFFQSILNLWTARFNSWKYADYYYDSVFNTMTQVKKNENAFYPEEYCRGVGIPSFKQYKAFNDLYEVVGDDEFLKNHKKEIYNLALLPLVPNTLQLLRRIENGKIEDVKKITIVCGSFWKKNIWVREAISKTLIDLHTKRNITVDLYTNCRGDEKEVGRLREFINYYYFIDRVMIHFTLIDDKYILLEYPHSEKIYLRLFMLLTPKDLNSDVLISKKKLLLDFFESLIIEAQTKNN
jgi:hypothetical protein